MVRTLFLAAVVMATARTCPVSAQSNSAVAPAIANTLSAEDAAAVDEAVVEQIKEQGLVGVAVGLLYEGEIVYLKGYGLADRERHMPVTTATVFNWASNSKPLCAVAAMQLVEQDRLDLDADVRSYVPEFPDHGRQITMCELLCHQSGIPHYSNGRIVPGANATRARAVDRPDLCARHVQRVATVVHAGQENLVFVVRLHSGERRRAKGRRGVVRRASASAHRRAAGNEEPGSRHGDQRPTSMGDRLHGE